MRVQSSGFGNEGFVLGLGMRVQGFKIEGLESRVWSEIYHLGLVLWDSRFRDYDVR